MPSNHLQEMRQDRLGGLRPYGRWATFFQIVGEVYASKIYSRCYSLRPGDVVLDLGAHVGTFAIYAAKQVGPTGRVIAFEPSGNNFRLLEQNVLLNGLDNVDLLNRGVWDREAELDLALSPMSSSHSLYVESSPAPRNGRIERVRVSTVGTTVFRRIAFRNGSLRMNARPFGVSSAAFAFASHALRSPVSSVASALKKRSTAGSNRIGVSHAAARATAPIPVNAAAKSKKQTFRPAIRLGQSQLGFLCR